jgi:hypothetical protein
LFYGVVAAPHFGGSSEQPHCSKGGAKKQAKTPPAALASFAAFGDAMREVNAAIEEMRGQHDPLASTFSSRAAITKTNPTPKAENGTICRPSWQQACDLGFRGTSKGGNGF